MSGVPAQAASVSLKVSYRDPNNKNEPKCRKCRDQAKPRCRRAWLTRKKTSSSYELGTAQRIANARGGKAIRNDYEAIT